MREEFHSSLSMADFLRRFVDAERIGGYCRECENYGRWWNCPPLGGPFDFGAYGSIDIFGVRFEAEDDVERYRTEREMLNRSILARERAEGGFAFFATGKCRLCTLCSRLDGSPCRHPQSVRPSLEAVGTDVAALVSECFGTELEWSSVRGKLPRRVFLVAAKANNY